MRLYLSSYGLGNYPKQILNLVAGKRVAVIMNAQDAKPVERRQERLQQEFEAFTSLGLSAKELDLRKYFDRKTKLKEELVNYDFIWVRGGNAFLLRRAFSRSGFDNLLIEMLRDDTIAYGGFSAGICILAPSLHGIELVDPTDEIADGYDKKVVWGGLGIINFAIAPHYKSNHPESDNIEKCVEYFAKNHMPYKTLRDGEVILINGNIEKLIK